MRGRVVQTAATGSGDLCRGAFQATQACNEQACPVKRITAELCKPVKRITTELCFKQAKMNVYEDKDYAALSPLRCRAKCSDENNGLVDIGMPAMCKSFLVGPNF